MSKIEDALKKAKASRSNLSQVASTNITVGENPVVSGRSISVVKKTSSLIKLMRDEATADEGELINKGIILPDSANADVTDSFRFLRTQLLQKSKNGNFIVLVTSCVDGPDSAFVSMNMGAAFSLDESKTSLVLDCDFQSDYFEDMLELDYEDGLIDFLEGEAEIGEILKDIGIKRLRLIPSGRRHQIESEYFTTDRMKVLLDGIVERYQDRFIVLNSPAISDSVDASILIDLVDYVVVVAPYAGVSVKDLDESIKKIDKSKLLGVVINDIPKWL